ncbi:oxidoreductase ptaK [Lachnellula suecica]|uniref:laccase n=1 Tax=Lachnellula suecica TaxID=602035 RepID=A0A8T9CK95_9HELO|nr:oxidoreductase ptaK [Lachnellula suecica]
MSLINSILKGASLLTAALSQTSTNGLSLWGTLDAPLLSFFDTTFSTTSPFGANDTLATTPPWSGRTKTYDWTISRGYIAPDGVNKSVILVNGQFPGPLLEANWGDTIQVTVRNNIPDEGTTVHWHGFLQKGTPWMDGVPAGSQCPIAPGSTFVYKFTADQYGTSWYHSHYSSQYSAGLFGPIVIYGPMHADYDIDIGPVMLHDWYHPDYYEVVERLFAVPPDPLAANNNLINGKMDFNCSQLLVNASCTPNAGISKFSFQSGKTHRLRLINPGSEGNQRFSIDGHTLTVIAVDFVPVEPYDTKVVYVGVGQRTDVLVKGIGKTGDAYWMRSNFSQLCASSPSHQPYAVAGVYYQGANTNARPGTTAYPFNETNCLNDPLNTTTPVVPMTPPSGPAVTQTININYIINGSGMFLFTMGGNSFRADYNTPVLLVATNSSASPAASNATSIYPTDWNVNTFGTNSSVRLIITNSITVSHPMHFHGHNFWILAEGNGNWDGTITNPSNPIRRDSFLMGASNAVGPAYTVIEYISDNPGVWPLHCHVAGHSSTGLYINILERPDLLSQDPQIPGYLSETCDPWNKWTSSHLVDEIDSGE